MDFTVAPGVFDVLPSNEKEVWRSSYLWNYLESFIRQIASEYGFQEIRTPIFERTELFQRGVGETSDIVSKEMYTFIDKGGRSISLRPEGTAPVMRAFKENNLHYNSPVHKLYYIGPMFRYERAQAGRYRQHHQFGAEVIGSSAPEQDAELIDMLYTLYSRLGLKNLRVNLNTIGDLETRIAFRKTLQIYFQNFYEDLSPESKIRLETNPLRILDSKDPKDQLIVKDAPSILDFLTSESKDHFEIVQNMLKSLGIPFQINASLVRGLDYYNKTVFEIVAGELGAQNSIAGGGRYDGLLKILGGQDLPATGFATGLERVIQTMLKQNVKLPKPFAPEVFLIAMGDQAKKTCFLLLDDLRKNGISAEMDFGNKKVGKLMQYANQIQAAHVAVIGDQELEKQEVELKDMQLGSIRKLPLMGFSQILKHEKQNKKCLQILSELPKELLNKAQVEFFLNSLNATISAANAAATDLKKAMQDLQT